MGCYSQAHVTGKRTPLKPAALTSVTRKRKRQSMNHIHGIRILTGEGIRGHLGIVPVSFILNGIEGVP